MAGQPKVSFYIAVAVVVLALLGFAGYQAGFFGGGGDEIGENGAGQGGSGGGGSDEPIKLPQQVTQVEDENSALITTAEEYKYVPAAKLPPIQGASAYKTLEDHTVRFALNVWAGWAPIIHANNGHRAGKVWKTADGQEFKVELVQSDDPLAMVDAYVTGNVHIGWATVDMMPLIMERLVDDSGKPVDPRVMPRVYQQVDWSNGGDGIVVRADIQEVKDLRGKTIVLAQNSPSHYFALNMLVAGGVQPSEVNFRFTQDAFEAARAFASERDIAACVSWAPDIYNLTKVQGNRMLVDTGTANRLIADVWFARADFARDHAPKIEAIVRGIFDSMDALKNQAEQQKVAGLMGEFYNIPENEAMGMLADAYSTGWGDNYQFFLNQNYLANFERVWNNAYYLYKRVGVVTKPRVPFDQVVDFSIIKKLGEEEKYQAQKPQKQEFAFREIGEGESGEAFLTATHYIHFFPNSADLYKKIYRKNEEGREVEELYDPNVDFVLEKIGEQIGQFERSRIVIEGHADSSMKGQVDAQLVKDLSEDRAEAVKQALVTRFDLDPNRLNAVGKGWDEPADENDPGNHAKNRRVEVQILPAEVQ